MDELKKMVKGFGSDELKELLTLVGRNHCGNDQELRARVLDLLRLKIPSVERRIRDIHYYSVPPTKKMGKSQRNRDIIFVPEAENYPTVIDLEADSNDRRPVGVRETNVVDTLPASLMQEIEKLEMPARRRTFQNYVRQDKCPPAATTSSKPSCSKSPDGDAHVYPVNPDVKFKQLPFYDVLTVLLRPSSLNRNYGDAFGKQENRFQFHLSPKEIQDISASTKLKIMIQLRFCLLETTCEQDDCFPPKLSVRINDCVCELPRRGGRSGNSSGSRIIATQGCCFGEGPINISQYCRLTPTKPNDVLVTWLPDFSGTAYALTIHLVRKLDTSTLVSRLRSKGISNVNQTKTIIQERLQLAGGRIEFATQMNPVIDSEFLLSLKVSLLCPISNKRIEIPCRSRDCAPHIQCFDATSYLKLNEKEPTWVCPVCEKPAPYNSLFIDGYILEALSAFTDCQTVLLNDAGLFKHVFTGAKEKGNAADDGKTRSSSDDESENPTKKKKTRAKSPDGKGLFSNVPVPKKEEDAVDLKEVKDEPKINVEESEIVVLDAEAKIEVVDLT